MLLSQNIHNKNRFNNVYLHYTTTIRSSTFTLQRVHFIECDHQCHVI